MILLLFLISLGTLSAADNNTADYALEDSGLGNNFNEIQEKIDYVDEKGTVNLDAKNYYPKSEIENFSVIEVNKPVNIVGVYNKTIIDGNDQVGILNIKSAGNVLVKDIIFTNAFGAVSISNSSVTFENCQFDSNDNGVGGAIAVNGNGETNIINCIFKNNIANGTQASVGGAIAILDGNNQITNIVNSTFINNIAMRGGAIYIAADDSKKGNLHITDSTFKGNGYVYDETELFDEELGGADISFYNPLNTNLINYEILIENSSFIGTYVDRSSQNSVLLSNSKNIIKNSNFISYSFAITDSMDIEFDKCLFDEFCVDCMTFKENIILKINNSNGINSYFNVASGEILNSVFNASGFYKYLNNNLNIFNSTFNGYSYISIDNGNVSIKKSLFDNSSVAMNEYSDDYMNINLMFIEDTFLNGAIIGADYSKTEFTNCSGLNNICTPVLFLGDLKITTYNSGKSFTLKGFNKNTNKIVPNLSITLKIYNKNSFKALKTYKLTTNSKGITSFNVNTLNVGEYYFSIVSNNKKYYYADHDGLIHIKKAKTTVKAPKVTNKYKKSKYFKVTVKNSASKKVVKNVKVKIKVYTGKKYKTFTVKTNSKGVAQINTKTLKKGTHKVVITSGNSNYHISKTSSIKIK